MLSAPLRSSVARLATGATGRLDVIWRQVDTADLARDALAEALPALIQAYGPAAATLAATWYDDVRVRRGVGGSFEAIPADLGDAGAQALAGWGVGPLYAAKPDWAAAQTLIAGGLQRRIANYARDTITQTTVADPRAVGWQREGIGDCDFCAMLIGRGAVYSEATADFESHDHCQCAAAPVFE